jgi:alkylation response protein AidB-like acyl-CoA dehydrogenase
VSPSVPSVPGQSRKGTTNLTRVEPSAAFEDRLTPERVRSELREWLADQWDPDLSLVEWRERLVSSRWAVPSWPLRWHGRGWPAWTEDAVSDELVGQQVVGLPIGPGTGFVAPTLLAHGPDAIRDRFLEPILTGRETWCQLFSEPGSGSDLAGLTTRADLDGEEWVVNGQKVWTTSAHHADFGILLARTDWDAPKHRGITFLALPMDQPGVTVRPLRQMNGYASFNEVFLTDARAPTANVIGDVGDGWRVAQTTLANERRFGSIFAAPRYPARPNRAFEEARAEMEEHFQPYVWYPQRGGRVDLLVDRARATGQADDLVVRQAIARTLTLDQVSKWTAARARIARAAGRQPGPEGSIGKLALSGVARSASAAHALIARSSAMLTGADAPLAGLIGEVLLSVPAQSIAGGTDEIQKNILAERILGLPRDPPADRDTPFRELPRNL